MLSRQSMRGYMRRTTSTIAEIITNGAFIRKTGMVNLIKDKEAYKVKKLHFYFYADACGKVEVGKRIYCAFGGVDDVNQAFMN